MDIVRLSWAGIQVTKDNFTVFIDPFENATTLLDLIGPPREPLFPVSSPSGEAAALITHIHADHCDPLLLQHLLGTNGYVYGPQTVFRYAMEKGLAARTAKLGKPFVAGPFEVTAVPAMDWRGEEQVSWVIKSDGATLFHGGDTIWHGYWWQIVREHGPFEMAFLPINGVVVHKPDVEPSGLPGTLTPRQAAVAARLLHARELCPIHFGTFNNPPFYTEVCEPIAALREAARQEGVKLRLLEPGASLRIG